MVEEITQAPPFCRYFDAGVCLSCTFIETPIAVQLQKKQNHCIELLPQVPAGAWLPAVFGGVTQFRNRAKLAVGGTRGAVTLGILDRGGAGVDLTECLIHEDGIQAVIPVFSGLLNESGLEPYSVPNRAGEVKYVHVTVNSTGELMVRFVVRSEHGLRVLRRLRPHIQTLLPNAVVISVNILPEHKAVLEGEREEVLVGEALAMVLAGTSREVTLYLRPQSFFQTNTRVALALYEQAAAWVNGVDPASIWDLYCGVGGFALFAATAPSDNARQRDVLGVELSEQAIRSAERSAREAQIPAKFYATDATAFALAALPADLPEFLVVNPPRRGIGPELAEWIEHSTISHVLYSSCNPESLARDLKQMPSLDVKEARLFDMFPHTGHLEVAVLLERSER